MNDFNDRIIAEFRENDGKVGGPFAGAHLVLITSTGAKSGQSRTSPVMYFPDGETVYVIASKAGAPTNPDWYHNLRANPKASLELATDDGVERFDATATVVAGPERDRLYAEFSRSNPGFAAYQEKTDRVIPIVAFHRE
ncbi:nitroreductase family deazaflavin-dependent oxidoreductase [Glaciihabitans sp. UYNi722]|uniref:nitroreductase family deazaflavin-dependent oxidoreductase n=1 Tax=Glaciihabitans sp. UYNi722 TaxID=3156344 RepID=UPI0033922409